MIVPHSHIIYYLIILLLYYIILLLLYISLDLIFIHYIFH